MQFFRPPQGPHKELLADPQKGLLKGPLRGALWTPCESPLDLETLGYDPLALTMHGHAVS